MEREVLRLIAGLTMLAFASTALACKPSPSTHDVGDTMPHVAATVDPYTAQSIIYAPKGWKKVDADRKFTFYLPPDMRDTGRSGTESLHREYTNGKMQVSFDYQPFGYLEYAKRKQAFGQGFQEMEMQVGGEKAFLFAYQDADRRGRTVSNADLYVGDLPNHQVKLQMQISSINSAVVAVAKKIFGTIVFPRE